MMFYYEALVYDEMEEQRRVARGFISGNGYGATLDELVDYFGDNNFIELRGLCELDTVMELEDLKFMFFESDDEEEN